MMSITTSWNKHGILLAGFVLVVWLGLAPRPAAAGHDDCVDPTDVNYGRYSRDWTPTHEGYHYGFHRSRRGHYGEHSGVHFSQEEGLHGGTHWGYHRSRRGHYGDHSGTHGSWNPYAANAWYYRGY